MPEKKEEEKKITYKDAGVDLDEQEKSNEMIKGLTKSDIGEGLFGGAVAVPEIKQMDVPILIMNVKSGSEYWEPGMSLAQLGERMIDDMCSNRSTKILGILDYMASDKLKAEETRDFVEGLKKVEQYGGRILGGETADMNVIYQKGQKDFFVTCLELCDWVALNEMGGRPVSYVPLDKFKKYEEPVLVASTDGVGTKTKIGIEASRVSGLMHDIINHCVNDIAVHGTLPLAFIPYIAGHSIHPETAVMLESGAEEAAENAGIQFLHGMLHDVPRVYNPKMIDIAGTVIGIIDKQHIIDGSAIKEGDIVVKLHSSGIGTNGYSLVRMVFFETLKHNLADYVPEFRRGIVAKELLEPHANYANAMLRLANRVDVGGFAHITGGGLEGNLSRIIPEGLTAVIDRKKLEPIPPVFRYIMEKGDIDEQEMFRVFNMGVGVAAVVPKEDAKTVVDYLQRSHHSQDTVIGRIEKGEKRFRWTGGR